MFKIVIIETKDIIRKRGKEWARKDAAPDSPYEYTPEIDKTVTSEQEIYVQRVDTLDLSSVIKAINGI